MIAHLYLSDDTFTHNGTDSVRDVNLKLSEFNSLIDILRSDAFKFDNKFYCDRERVYNAKLYNDGASIINILTDYDVSKERYGKDVITILQGLLKHFLSCKLPNEELMEYLDLEDENECNGLLVLNRLSKLDENRQVMSNIKGWLAFRRYYLAKYPKDKSFFFRELCKYYPKLKIHPSVEKSINEVFPHHCKLITEYLTILEEYLIKEFFECGKGDFVSFMEWFKQRHHLDGASFEGNKDRKFVFLFDDNEAVYCEAHLKIYQDDRGNSNQHCRIHFGRPQTAGDHAVYVGYIGQHM